MTSPFKLLAFSLVASCLTLSSSAKAVSCCCIFDLDSVVANLSARGKKFSSSFSTMAPSSAEQDRVALGQVES